jgi:hypothetical protein
MTDSEHIVDQITLRSTWRKNLELLLVVFALVGASVLFILAY